MRSVRSMRGGFIFRSHGHGHGHGLEGPCKRYAMARHVCQATTASLGRRRSVSPEEQNERFRVCRVSTYSSVSHGHGHGHGHGIFILATHPEGI